MEPLLEFMHQQSTLTLASTSPAGRPAAADLYFVTDKTLNLYFVSEPQTRHAQNLADNPQVAGTIHAPAWDWREIRGVQFTGICQALKSPAERAGALALYGRKFSFVHSFAAAITRHIVYRIDPQWIRWLDNSITFGHQREWERQGGAWISSYDG